MMESVALHNKTLLEDLEEGDIVEFERPFFYSHYGVYVGQGKIIHRTSNGNARPNSVQCSGSSSTSSSVPSSCFGKTIAKACIKKDDFWEVANNCEARKKNKDDGEKFRPRSKTEIVKNAEAKLGQVGYNIFYKNCEHFSNSCRYGIEQSDQVDGFFTGLGHLAGLGPAAAGIGVGAGMLMGGKEDKQKE